ncbi:MAG: CCA tRNA nucleotidyltransferase, partial [Planctomycetota bacterium]
MDPKRKAAEAIVQILKTSGHVSMFAGGCVRDHLRGEIPKDWDIVTAARPEVIQQLFPKTVPVGMKFGVVLVLHEGFQFEVTTFRSEEGYSDGRHPDRVRYTDLPEEDARRRDFTINGLYLDPETGEVFDWVGGRADLAAGILRTIGNPEDRFSEDYLRMLRAARFVASLGLNPDPDTVRTLQRLAMHIASISAERVRDELLKILLTPGRRQGVEFLQETGLLQVVLPEVSAMRGVEQPTVYHPEGDVFEHTLLMLERVESPSETLTLGILLHDIGKPVTLTLADRIRFNKHAKEGARMASAICSRLRLSREQTKRVVA